MQPINNSILGKHPLEDAVVPDSKIARYEEKSVPMDVEGEIKLDDPISPIPLLPIELYQEILKRALLAGVSYSDLCRVCKGFKALTFDTANRLFSAPIEDLKNYFPKSNRFIEYARVWHTPVDPTKTFAHSMRRVILLSPSLLAVLPSSSEEDGIEKKLKKSLLPFTDEMFFNIKKTFATTIENYKEKKITSLPFLQNLPYDAAVILNQLTLSQESKEFFKQWENPESIFKSIKNRLDSLAIQYNQKICDIIENSFKITKPNEEFKNDFKFWKDLFSTHDPLIVLQKFDDILKNKLWSYLQTIQASEQPNKQEIYKNYYTILNGGLPMHLFFKKLLKKNDFIKNWLKQKIEEIDPSLTNDIEKNPFNVLNSNISLHPDHKNLQMDQKLFEYIDQFIISDEKSAQTNIIANRYLQSIFDRVITYGIAPLTNTKVQLFYYLPTPCLRIFSNLEKLSVSKIASIEFGLSYLTALTQLTISNSELPYLPPDLQGMTQLRHLHLKGTKLNSIDLLYSLTQLETLILPKYRCAYDITHFTSFAKLQMLTAPESVHVVDLPSTIERMTALKTLHLEETFWPPALPKTMKNMTQLTSLKTARNPFICVAAQMCQKRDPTKISKLNQAFDMHVAIPDLAFTDSTHQQEFEGRSKIFTLPCFPLFREIPVQIYLEDAGEKIYSKESPYKLKFYASSDTSTDQFTIIPYIAITATFPHVTLKKKKVTSSSTSKK